MRLLVNFVYAHALGHAIEALHYCHGYHQADPAAHIEAALVSTTPHELAALCPYIADVHPIDVDFSDGDADLSAVVGSLPRDWDWVLDDGRGHMPEQRAFFPGMGKYYDLCGQILRATHRGSAGDSPPAYQHAEPFRLTFPGDVRARAARHFCGRTPKIAILPAGSSPRTHYPSVHSWQLVISALVEEFPDAQLCLVGKRAVDGRTSSSFGRAEFAALKGMSTACVDAVDIALVDQLAMVAECDVLVSPHSGFGMAALAVGTPWLTIAGNRWPEYYFPGTPFYSVLPDVRRYPCYTGLDAGPLMVSDADGQRTPSMSDARMGEDLDQIVAGAAQLIRRAWSFPAAVSDHVDRLLRLYGGDRARIVSIDDVLETELATAHL